MEMYHQSDVSTGPHGNRLWCFLYAKVIQCWLVLPESGADDHMQLGVRSHRNSDGKIMFRDFVNIPGGLFHIGVLHTRWINAR